MDKFIQSLIIKILLNEQSIIILIVTHSFLFIFLSVALIRTVLTLNRGNEARCQISLPLQPSMPIVIHLEYDKKRASEAYNANKEAEELLVIFLLVALEGTVLTLNSGNEARCQISPPPLLLMPMQIFGI